MIIMKIEMIICLSFRLMNIGKLNGLTVFAIVFLTFSCHIIEQKNGPLDGSPALWDIKDSIVQIHSYNKNGLADSTFQIWYHFRNGKKWP